MSTIQERIQERIFILDGAMGTMVQSYQLEEQDYRKADFQDHTILLKGNHEVLNLTQPQIIQEIHQAYLEAGADIITANTFNANRISQADYKLEDQVEAMNRSACQIAHRALAPFRQEGRACYVYATLGPTNKTASISPDVHNPSIRAVTFEELRLAYLEQIEILIQEQIDGFIIETVFDTLNAKAALLALEQAQSKYNMQLPVMISATIADASGRTLSGQTLEAFLYSISHFDLLSVGLNCSMGADNLLPYIEELAQKAPFAVSVHPNAGLPNELGAYDETPEVMLEKMIPYFEKGLLNIVGGCCGTTPDHIASLAAKAAAYAPRIIQAPTTELCLSGLESLLVDQSRNFINVGERTNVAGSRKFARLIKEKNYDEALQIARNQVEGGAQVIDVNLDDAMLDAKNEMTTFLNLIMSDPEIARLPIMIDSSDWEVIEAGLQCVQGKSIVNSISLKEGETSFINRARKIKQYGAAVVVMAFDETGQATTYERRIEIMQRAYHLLVNQAKFQPQDIIFDPNILTVATGMEEHDSYALDFIRSVAWVKKNLPLAKVSGGVSNVSFAFRGNNIVREAMHAVFLYHAIQAGMDMGIVNPSMLQIYDEIEPELLRTVEGVILNTHPQATEELINLAQSYQGKNITEHAHEEVWRQLPVQERMIHALLKGITTHLAQDMSELISCYDQPLEIIEGPLMQGMDKVGELFGEGKMFLPQVIKSARVMKQAVDYVTPLLTTASGDLTHSRPKIILATVKGDVHDIGKNIVGVILACNHYEVIDLGVMVSTEQILDAIAKHRPQALGLSGLITPSLQEMGHVLVALQMQGHTLPVIIGGATTSSLHTAVKLDPLYDGIVVRIKDASQVVTALKSILKGDQTYLAELLKQNERLRTQYAQNRKMPMRSLAEAQQHRLILTEPSPNPAWVGIQTIEDVTLADLRPWIDWRFFFPAWGLKGSYPQIFDMDHVGSVAQQLFDEAQTYLDRMEQENLLHPIARLAILPADKQGEDILLWKEDRSQELGKIHGLRNQQKDQKENLSLVDFIHDQDHVGLFALTIQQHEHPYFDAILEDEYATFMVQLLSDRLAEAFAEYLHHRVRTQLWGYEAAESHTMEELHKGQFQGIRPALGYAACPDHSEKKLVFDLLQAQEKLNMSLSENFAMTPTSSVCGYYFAHEQSSYFDVAKIDQEQVQDYALRKDVTTQHVEHMLSTHLNYSPQAQD